MKASDSTIICINPVGHKGHHVFVPVGDDFSAYGKCLERPVMVERELTQQERDLGHWVVQDGVPESQIMQPADSIDALHMKGKQPLVVASELRELAQCALAAAVLAEGNNLHESAEAVFGAWCKALPLIRSLTGQFPGSMAALAIRRAYGMLLNPIGSREAATRECAALLGMDEELNSMLVKGNRRQASARITDDVIEAYLKALEGWMK